MEIGIFCEGAMRSFTRAALIIAAVLVTPVAGLAVGPGGGNSPNSGTPSGIVAGFSAQDISQLLTDAGFQSEVQKDKDNSQYIVTNFWNGPPYAVTYPYSFN